MPPRNVWVGTARSLFYSPQRLYSGASILIENDFILIILNNVGIS
jgi:hypothetical protein